MHPGHDREREVEQRQRRHGPVPGHQVEHCAARYGEQLDDGEGDGGTEGRGIPRHQRVGLDPGAKRAHADVGHDAVHGLDGDEGQPHQFRFRDPARRQLERKCAEHRVQYRQRKRQQFGVGSRPTWRQKVAVRPTIVYEKASVRTRFSFDDHGRIRPR